MHAQLTLFLSLFLGGLVLNGNELDLERIIAKHCFDCHGDQKSKGGLNLQQLLQSKPLIRHRKSWDHVLELVQQKEMPPEEDSRITPEEQRTLLALLDKEVNHFDFSTVNDPGFEQARRLSKHEYLNTVRDLFGVSQLPDLKFPDEMAGASGFDNSANTLFLQTSLMSRYIAAAERVVSTLMPDTTANTKLLAVRKRMIVAYPSAETTALEAAQRVLQQLLLRAYRRPSTPDEIQRYLLLFDSVYRVDSTLKGYELAIKQCIQAVLISPKFLFRTESDFESTEPYRIDSFELASRLSYFLWASMPDGELLDAAFKDNLHQPELLAKQVRRMVKDEKADTLGNLFAAQWLGFGLLGNRIRLDPIDNPWCTDSLMQSMREESALFFVSLVRGNRSVAGLINAPYTFMNEELSREIYGLDSIRGNHMRQVTLNDSERAGMLTHGSLMAITSNYKETSPIKRGYWILETLLGKPLPPPPPNAGAFREELENNDALTFQEKVELHSNRASCKSCHSKIDPLGFSLENFDYFGRWRDSYRVWRPERENHDVWLLLQSMQLMDANELHRRLVNIDLEPDDFLWAQQVFARLMQLDEADQKSEIDEAITVVDQRRLIMILKEMEIEPLESEDPWFQSIYQGINELRSIPVAELQDKLNSLELPDDEKQACLILISRALNLPQVDYKTRLSDLGEETLDQLAGCLEALGIMDWEEEENDGEDRFDLVEITGNVELSDGTRFQGSTGLRQNLLARHLDDMSRQLIRKMLSYALGRQLEYYDEKAVEDIMSHLKKQKYAFDALIHGIVTSYPFQFKKATHDSQ
ncbi:DUF1592 domain-containing protein [Verrucomicrobia bacterium]|nr:DUF1592 domain-containing protein [Verrucomicrobiota bacterium]